MNFDNIVQMIMKWLSSGSVGIFGGIFGVFGLGIAYMILKKRIVEAASNAKLKKDVIDSMNEAQEIAVQTSKDMKEAEEVLRSQDKEDEAILRGKK